MWRICREELSFCVGTHLIPHPSKVVHSCKASFFICPPCIFVPHLCWGLEFFFFFFRLEFLVFIKAFVYLQELVFGKVEKGGEDAFFVSTYNGGVIAVADGVSGYEFKVLNSKMNDMYIFG